MTEILTVQTEDAIWEKIAAASEGVLGIHRGRDGGVRVLPFDPVLASEEYRLRRVGAITELVAGSPAGAFRALTSIRGGSLDIEDAHDAPSFRWRGFMIDVARWFVPVDELLLLIDQLAVRRLNVLHLHLTDDQGWRVPVPGWPKLTEIGAWRDGTTTRPAPVEGMPDPRINDEWGHGHQHDETPHGGYYTRDELEHIVAYAADRFVTVVPEIDLPGHMQAAIASYSTLGVGAPDLPVATRFGLGPSLLAPTSEVEGFLRDVLSEICEIFPSHYVHIGGDEPRLETWRSDVVSGRRAESLGFSGTDSLRGWFVDVAAGILAEKGRTALYWYDGEVLSAKAIAVSWLADDGGIAAAQAGARVITADHTRTYLNYFASEEDSNPYACGIVLDDETAAGFRAAPDAPAELYPRFLGGQAQLWTEYAPHREARESLMFPRLDLIADALWNGS